MTTTTAPDTATPKLSSMDEVDSLRPRTDAEVIEQLRAELNACLSAARGATDADGPPEWATYREVVDLARAHKALQDAVTADPAPLLRSAIGRVAARWPANTDHLPPLTAALEAVERQPPIGVVNVAFADRNERRTDHPPWPCGGYVVRAGKWVRCPGGCPAATTGGALDELEARNATNVATATANTIADGERIAAAEQRARDAVDRVEKLRKLLAWLDERGSTLDADVHERIRAVLTETAWPLVPAEPPPPPPAQQPDLAVEQIWRERAEKLAFILTDLLIATAERGNRAQQIAHDKKDEIFGFAGNALVWR
jgi:hypothetical protein